MARNVGAGLAALVLGLAVLSGTTPAATAAEDPDPFAETCDDADLIEEQLPATCIDGVWVSGDGFDPMGDSSEDFGAMVALIVFVGLFGGGVALWWRVSTARNLARKAGMDPDDAGTMAAFTDGGLEATYLASQLRPTAPAVEPVPVPAPAPAPDATARLAEIQRLRDAGLITPEEYDAQRRRILDSI